MAIVPAGVIEQPAHVLELVNQVQQAQPESFHIRGGSLSFQLFCPRLLVVLHMSLQIHA
uniref:hypothetical protein n=1 Tax=Aquipseudomonas alcaligenes TaxID=43263 RepID=UPI00155DD98D|nr:hypothetical protein [Pseudomonas alcaligenes]